MDEFIDTNQSEIITSIVTAVILGIVRFFEKRKIKKNGQK